MKDSKIFSEPYSRRFYFLCMVERLKTRKKICTYYLYHNYTQPELPSFLLDVFDKDIRIKTSHNLDNIFNEFKKAYKDEDKFLKLQRIILEKL